MFSEAINHHGQTFGRLTVIGRAGRDPRFNTRAAWSCRCECGRVVDVEGRKLRTGNTRSCGCLKRDEAADRLRTHGKSRSRSKNQPAAREYVSWAAAKTRSYNKNQRCYPNYGGRDIHMCERWRESFEAFLEDMGPCPVGHSIDRIDVNGHYEPGNCRWAEPIVQANNTRANHFIEFNDARRTVADWERHLGLKSGTLKRRLLRGWPIDKAMTAPLRAWPHR